MPGAHCLHLERVDPFNHARPGKPTQGCPLVLEGPGELVGSDRDSTGARGARTLRHRGGIVEMVERGRVGVVLGEPHRCSAHVVGRTGRLASGASTPSVAPAEVSGFRVDAAPVVEAGVVELNFELGYSGPEGNLDAVVVAVGPILDVVRVARLIVGGKHTGGGEGITVLFLGVWPLDGRPEALRRVQAVAEFVLGTPQRQRQNVLGDGIPANGDLIHTEHPQEKSVYLMGDSDLELASFTGNRLRVDNRSSRSVDKSVGGGNVPSRLLGDPEESGHVNDAGQGSRVGGPLDSQRVDVEPAEVGSERGESHHEDERSGNYR